MVHGKPRPSKSKLNLLIIEAGPFIKPRTRCGQRDNKSRGSEKQKKITLHLQIRSVYRRLFAGPFIKPRATIGSLPTLMLTGTVVTAARNPYILMGS